MSNKYFARIFAFLCAFRKSPCRLCLAFAWYIIYKLILILFLTGFSFSLIFSLSFSLSVSLSFAIDFILSHFWLSVFHRASLSCNYACSDCCFHCCCYCAACLLCHYIAFIFVEIILRQYLFRSRIIFVSFRFSSLNSSYFSIKQTNFHNFTWSMRKK